MVVSLPRVPSGQAIRILHSDGIYPVNPLSFAEKTITLFNNDSYTLGHIKIPTTAVCP